MKRRAVHYLAAFVICWIFCLARASRPFVSALGEHFSTQSIRSYADVRLGQVVLASFCFTFLGGLLSFWFAARRHVRMAYLPFGLSFAIGLWGSVHSLELPIVHVPANESIIACFVGGRGSALCRGSLVLGCSSDRRPSAPTLSKLRL